MGAQIRAEEGPWVKVRAHDSEIHLTRTVSPMLSGRFRLPPMRLYLPQETKHIAQTESHTVRVKSGDEYQLELSPDGW